jgi:hypothetical protein
MTPRRLPFPTSASSGWLARLFNGRSSRDIPEGEFRLVTVLGSIRRILYSLYHQSADACPFVRTGTFPGSQDIGSSLGVYVGGRETLLCAMLGGATERAGNRLWIGRMRYLRRADGVVMVLKKHQTKEDTRAVTETILRAMDAASPGVPLLVLVRSDADLAAPHAVADVLGLPLAPDHATHHPPSFLWRIQLFDPGSLHGLAQGLHWLVTSSTRKPN